MSVPGRTHCCGASQISVDPEMTRRIPWHDSIWASVGLLVRIVRSGHAVAKPEIVKAGAAVCG